MPSFLARGNGGNGLSHFEKPIFEDWRDKRLEVFSNADCFFELPRRLGSVISRMSDRGLLATMPAAREGTGAAACEVGVRGGFE